MAKFYRVNQSIPNRQLLVIDSDGQKLGVIERDEALEKAKGQELDLVEIAPQANPPVAKIIDFQKFRYEESKKEQAAKKHAKDVGIKEIWLSPRIAEHDLQTRLNRAEEFLQEGNKVLFRVKFKGREMGHTELGAQLINIIIETISEKMDGKTIVEREPKMEGRSMTVILSKISKGNVQSLTN